MIGRTLILFSCTLLFTACANIKVAHNANDAPLFVSKKCALYIMIPDNKINKVINEMGEEEADDNAVYLNESLEFLRKNNIEVKFIKPRKAIFKKLNGEKIEINKDVMDINFSKYILFNKVDDPVFTDPMDIESEFKEYIEK